MRCAVGRSGVKHDKREGDGATPAGVFPLRQVFFREDRVGRPDCALPVRPLSPGDGWSDDPKDPAYNRLVTVPHAYRHERLWREDGVYDILVTLGHNDDPPVAGKGSAVFLHLSRPDFSPTEGCVALAETDLRRVLRLCRRGDALRVSAPQQH